MIAAMDLMKEDATEMKTTRQSSSHQQSRQNQLNVDLMNSDATLAFAFQDVMFAMDSLIVEEVKKLII